MIQLDLRKVKWFLPALYFPDSSKVNAMEYFLVDILRPLNKVKQLVLTHSAAELRTTLTTMMPVLGNTYSMVLDSTNNFIPRTCSTVDENVLSV